MLEFFLIYVMPVLVVSAVLSFALTMMTAIAEGFTIVEFISGFLFFILLIAPLLAVPWVIGIFFSGLSKSPNFDLSLGNVAAVIGIIGGVLGIIQFFRSR